ncbi:hypothetical protein HRbin10_01934 [bacterium HR10]|uniref:Zinc-finger domain-containing protein n=1 Tax=uncultured Acidobacteriota bacterium TaxID=171953 RepID=H5SBR6_9BACT|nr:hypothetical protein HGMM_F07F07C13 [uncultured Acidobacteriota bacterium]GBC82802.1 hypothetical protein HRbin10_01934 [bacterium HR10]
MTCGRLRREWEPDGPIPSWARAHVAECTACRAHVEELSRLRRALAALAEVPVPEDFTHRVRARALVARPPALWPRALAVAALGAIAVALLFTLERERSSPPEGPRAFVASPSSAEIAPREMAPHATSREAPETAALGKRPRVAPPARSKGDQISRMTTPASVGPNRTSARDYEAVLSEAFVSREADPSDAPLSHDGVILLLRNEETQEESILAIPPVVFGSRLLPLRPASPTPGERRRIL